MKSRRIFHLRRMPFTGNISQIMGYVAQSKYSEMGCYEAWALADISGIEPETMYYTIEEVRYYIRIALKNIAAQNPKQSVEVREIIARYALANKTDQ